jgi:integrase/recombinase XerD
VREVHVEIFREELLWRPCQTGQLYAQSTVDQALGSVRLWMKWAVRKGWLLVNPTEKMTIPRRAKVAGRYLTMAEVERLLATPDRSTLLGLRDAALLEALYSTGLRRAECHALDLVDVHFETHTIRVMGKGAWQRLAPMGEALAAVLDRYLHECRPALFDSPLHAQGLRDPTFFLSKSGTRLSLQAISQVVEATARQAGLPPLSAHMLRHAFAQHMLENGADYFAVQYLMGHARPQSTEVYTPVEHGVLRQTFRLTHPRAQRHTLPDKVPFELVATAPPPGTPHAFLMFDQRPPLRDNGEETSAPKEVKAS